MNCGPSRLYHGTCGIMPGTERVRQGTSKVAWLFFPMRPPNSVNGMVTARHRYNAPAATTAKKKKTTQRGGTLCSGQPYRSHCLLC